MKKILIIIMSFVCVASLLCACGTEKSDGNKAIDQTKENTTKSADTGIIEYPFSEPFIVIDNELIRFTITGKMYVDPENKGKWMHAGGAVGYSCVLENKTDEVNFNMSFNQMSVGDNELDIQAGPYFSTEILKAGKKSETYMYIPLDGRYLGANINTGDDLKDVSGELQIHFDQEYNGERNIDIPIYIP